MKFEVELSERADYDLRDIFLYIAIDLCSPENAEKQLSRLWKEIKSLDKLPERHRPYDEEPWLNRGFRIFPVDNYNVLYTVDTDKKIVQIVRVIYSGRDISEQIRKL